jgi:hypothetical protein
VISGLVDLADLRWVFLRFPSSPRFDSILGRPLDYLLGRGGWGCWIPALLLEIDVLTSRCLWTGHFDREFGWMDGQLEEGRNQTSPRLNDGRIF